MRAAASINKQIESQSVRLVESTIPGDVTVAEWRAHPRRQPAPAEQCGHLHDTTTRYDHDQKLLHFLLICPVCNTETLIETQPYEPRFTDPAPAGATVHQIPIPRHDPRLRHAA